MTDLNIIPTLTPGDVITYTTNADFPNDMYTAIVVSCVDNAVSLIDIESTNKNYITPQGYTYNDYTESVQESQLCNVTKINHINLLDYLFSQLPEYFI